MPPLPSEALATQRAELRDRLARRLAASDAPMAELRDLQERLRMIEGVLAGHQAPPGWRIGRSLAPMGLVAVVLTLAAALPVPSVPLALELQATSATLELGDATVIGPLALGGRSRIEGITLLESPDATLARAFAAERADSLTLLGGEARLLALHLPQGARLTVQAGRDAMPLRVESPHSPVQAEFELRGHSQLRLGDAAQTQTRNDDHGEWLQVTAGDPSRDRAVPPPLSLSLGQDDSRPLRLAGLRPVALRFSERRDSGGAVAALGSSLEVGTLTLPATGETVKLAAGDWLEIDGLSVERCEVVAGAPLTLKLNGSARALKLRVGEFERSLKPSWLEYTARHHLVQLLWGSAAVLWGALAWMRKQFADAH